MYLFFFFSSRRRHTRLQGDWSSDVCSSDLAIDFKAFGFFEGDGVGLMRSLLEHGGKAEKFAVGRFVDDDFLVVFVNSRDADAAGDHDVGMTVGVPYLVDALTWSEFLQFDLTGKDRCFIVIEKREERDVF